jgi:hypothetical protein
MLLYPDTMGEKRFNDVILPYPETENLSPPSSYPNKNGANLSDLKMTFAQIELESYTTTRTQNIAKKSVYWIAKASAILWEKTHGEVSQTSMTSLHRYITTQFTSYDSWGKVLNFTKSFLKYLSKLHLDPSYQNFALFLDMPKTRRDRKSVTSRIVTTVDITRVIDCLFDAYVAQHLSYESMVNYLGITLFGAYTGQRVEATISKITVAQLRTALDSSPSILHVNPIQDKIRMEHYVPIHPDLHQILAKMIENKADDSRAFEFVGYQMWLKRNRISLSRVPDKTFTPSDLRKFAEQYGDIIRWDHTNRAYVLTHGVSGIDWSHYKHPLPEYVYVNYMQYWGSVHLLEKEIPGEISRTTAIQPSSLVCAAPLTS